jgi:Zn-dependent protease with chaperone function
MYGGSHSHGGGSSGAHSHGSGGGSSGGVVVAILLGIVVLGVIVTLVVHAISQHRALSADSVLTPRDKLIQSAERHL